MCLHANTMHPIYRVKCFIKSDQTVEIYFDPYWIRPRSFQLPTSHMYSLTCILMRADILKTARLFSGIDIWWHDCHFLSQIYLVFLKKMFPLFSNFSLSFLSSRLLLRYLFTNTNTSSQQQTHLLQTKHVLSDNK